MRTFHIGTFSVITAMGLTSCAFVSDNELEFRMSGKPSYDDCGAVWHPDEDGDGYGSGDAVYACDAPVGHVSNDLDCDDGDPLISPDAVEDCATEADENCDGAFSAVDALNCTPFYTDQDGDGYGDPLDSICACEPTETHVTASEGDCEDLDAAVNPDAEEVCDDGLDNNCDGESNDCGLVGDIPLAGAKNHFLGEGRNDYVGTSVAIGSEILGTDHALLMSAPNSNVGGEDSGKLYITSPRTESETDLSQAEVMINGEHPGGLFGFFLTDATDLSGDGQVDLPVSAPLASIDDDAESGMVHLFYGPLSGVMSSSDADVLLFGESPGDRFGWTMATGNFLSEDSVDFAVGAYNTSQGLNKNGAIYLFSTPLPSIVASSQADAVIYGDQDKAYAGYSLAAGVDYTGDGFADIATGGYRQNDESGATYLLTGPFEGTRSLADSEASWAGVNPGDRAGIIIGSAGDLDGDGVEDVAVVGTGVNTVYLVSGMTSGAFSIDEGFARIENVEGNGSSLNAKGLKDIDGDGRDDLGVGAPSGNLAQLFYGPLEGVLDASAADAVFTVGQPSQQLGSTIGPAGDVNSDGCSDILIGARYSSEQNNRAGSVYLVLGAGL